MSQFNHPTRFHEDQARKQKTPPADELRCAATAAFRLIIFKVKMELKASESPGQKRLERMFLQTTDTFTSVRVTDECVAARDALPTQHVSI